MNQPTEQQRNEWKSKHGAIYDVEIDGKLLILRKPKIADLERAIASDPGKKKPFNFNRSILNNCKLYADDGMLEDDDTLQSIFSALDEIIEIKEASIKKA